MPLEGKKRYRNASSHVELNTWADFGGYALLAWMGWQSPVVPNEFFTLYWWLDWYKIANYRVSLCRISKFIQEKSQNSVLVSLLLPFLYQSNMEQVGNYFPSLWNISFSFNKIFLLKMQLKTLLITCHLAWLGWNQVFMCLQSAQNTPSLCIDVCKSLDTLQGCQCPGWLCSPFHGEGLQKFLCSLYLHCSQSTKFLAVFEINTLLHCGFYAPQI